MFYSHIQHSIHLKPPNSLQDATNKQHIYHWFHIYNQLQNKVHIHGFRILDSEISYTNINPTTNQQIIKQRSFLYVQSYTSQQHIYTIKSSNYKTECQEKLTLNRRLVQNELLREFCALPIPISSSWILRDSQRIKFHTSYYKTIDYAHLRHKQQEAFQRKMTCFSAKYQGFSVF